MKKLFYPINHYDSGSRTYLFPLLRSIKQEEIELQQGEKIVEVSGEKFCYTDSLNKSDIVILTMSWNYYVRTEKENKAIQLIEKANAKQKPVWLAIVDDVGFVIPNFKNVVVYRYSGYKSKLPKNHRGLPVFIPEPKTYEFSTKDVDFPKYTSKPIVGFCGLASKSILLKIKQLIKIVIKNIAFYLKLYSYTPNVLIAVQYLRYQALKRLSSSASIDTRFLLRNKYRAGAKTSEERYASSKEFYDNIAESQYILCVRGAGNFSTRLYETLAMGRIPIYIHTDDLLPLTEEIDWKGHVVWVNWHERKQIVEKTIEFHNKHNEKSLKALAKSNRLLWETHLQMGRFFKKIIDIKTNN